MRTRNLLVSGITAAVTISIFLFTACKKGDNATGEDTGYAQDHATLEKTYDDAQNISDQAAASGGTLSTYRVGGTILSGCATVTHDSVNLPHTITVDFGPTNCLCQDGNYRRGKIIITYTGHYKDAGSVHSIAFDNYFVNDNQVTGTKTVTNMGTNSSNQVYYTINVSGSIILANNAGTISWTSTRTRTWTAGYSTSAWNDDEYEITGSGSVTRANGHTFTLNITSPLHVATDCRWISQGTLQITPQNAVVRTLDYGNGTCDALATLTVNGTTYNVTLHH